MNTSQALDRYRLRLDEPIIVTLTAAELNAVNGTLTDAVTGDDDDEVRAIIVRIAGGELVVIPWHAIAYLRAAGVHPATTT